MKGFLLCTQIYRDKYPEYSLDFKARWKSSLFLADRKCRTRTELHKLSLQWDSHRLSNSKEPQDEKSEGSGQNFPFRPTCLPEGICCAFVYSHTTLKWGTSRSVSNDHAQTSWVGLLFFMGKFHASPHQPHTQVELQQQLPELSELFSSYPALTLRLLMVTLFMAENESKTNE